MNAAIAAMAADEVKTIIINQTIAIDRCVRSNESLKLFDKQARFTGIILTISVNFLSSFPEEVAR